MVGWPKGWYYSSQKILLICVFIQEFLNIYFHVYLLSFGGIRFAIKELQTTDVWSAMKAKEEADLVLPLEKHYNLIQYIESFSEEGVQYIVLELANQGDLGKAIALRKRNDKMWDAEFVVDVTSQIAAGLKFLHDNNVIHRDIKPQNLLLHQEPRTDLLLVKISDFGMSRAIGEATDYLKTQCGTKMYMPPEAHGGKYYFPTDIWSFGCVLFEIGYAS